MLLPLNPIHSLLKKINNFKLSMVTVAMFVTNTAARLQ